MVTRQQFIDGTAYPPAATGLRGSHPGSFEVAHALRDGERFEVDGLADADDVDLVVVGAGISGLAAAWFYRREHPGATILLLDNHDDFGGHAKRNEFTVDGRFLLGYGGSEALQSPEALYGPEAKGLLAALGVDHHRFERYFDTDLYPSLGLSRGQFFTKEAFGEDRLVAGRPDADGRRRHPGRPDARTVARGLHRGLPAARGVAARAGRAVHVGARPDAVARCRRQARRAVADQLPRLRPAVLGARRPRGRHVPGTIARLLRDRRRRHHGVRRDGDGLPGVRRHAARVGPARARRDGGAVHLSLPRRERVDRAPARPLLDPGGRARLDDGGHRHRSVRLRDARPAGRAGPAAVAEHRGARGERRRRGAGGVRPRRGAHRGARPPRDPRRLPHDGRPDHARAAAATSAARSAATSRRRCPTRRSRCTTGGRGSSAACTRSRTRWGSSRG